MSRICCIGVSFAVVFVFVGLYAFDEQLCKDGTYDFEKFQCLSCQDALGESCNLCSNENYCYDCWEGYHLNGRNCSACNDTFKENCTDCTATSCLNCLPGTYMVSGQCFACETLLGCDIENGGCGETGCLKC